jgi:uncharacterized protein
MIGQTQRKSFGLGLDLSWNSQFGFLKANNQYIPSDHLKNFLIEFETEFDHFFFSLQPFSYDFLFSKNAEGHYFRSYDRLLELIPKLQNSVSLHHTFLNMATSEKDYPRQKIVEFTNKIIDRYNIQWINEDLGFWLIKGKTLPYPLPPLLNEACLRSCIDNINFYKRHLNAELYVEFPGFSEGNSFFLGDINAFEFFKRVIEETQTSCVLDTGHILSYQWHIGNSHKFLENLNHLLPIEFCKEIHLSGCSIINDEFFDFHHGVILDEQLEILKALVPVCSQLKTITYEDPKFSKEGFLIEKAIPNYKRLKTFIDEWKNNYE